MSVTGKKRIITALSFVAIIVLAAGLSLFTWNFINSDKDSKSNLQNKSTGQIVDSIINKMNYKDIMKLDDEQLTKHYDIDKEILEEFTLYMSSNIESAFEIACFKLRRADDVAVLTAAVSSHMTNKASGFKDLNPAQYNLIMSYQTAVIDNYVFVIASNDAEVAKQAFLDLAE
ncbi:MAG: DUF4358 domain-containing protein [Acutalibacteraceae bacterium]